MNDLHVYDPFTKSWTDLSSPASGIPPSPRDSHGFTAAAGKLYVHGGEVGNGEGPERVQWLLSGMQKFSLGPSFAQIACCSGCLYRIIRCFWCLLVCLEST